MDKNSAKNIPKLPKVKVTDLEVNPGEQFKNIYLKLLSRSQRNAPESTNVSSLATVLREEAMLQAENSYQSMMEIRKSLQQAYQEVVNLQTTSTG